MSRRPAVAETGNQVILYQGQLIDAVFHSSSSAATQDAVEVWGNAVPYLSGVDSPEGEEVPNYHSTASVPVLKRSTEPRPASSMSPVA